MSMKKGQHIFGTVKVGEKGQIVIPKEARQIFDIKSGDTLLVLGDEEQGIAIVKADVMKELAVKILKGLGKLSNGIEDENSIMTILPIVFILDLLIPFILAPAYKGYNHLIQVMSVLGNSKAPLHIIYNAWLVVFGITLIVIDFNVYAIISESSKLIAVTLFVILLIYAIGGCILSGLFPVGEVKSLATLSEKYMGMVLLLVLCA